MVWSFGAAQNTSMKLLSDLVGGILRGVMKVALLAMTAVFVLGVLFVGLIVVLATALRFVMTGRKPAVVTTFTRFSQAAQQFRPGGGDVVDVQAHEVRAAPGTALPPKTAD
jgi:hypothetical protein